MSVFERLAHLLDPAWRRTPFPVSPRMRVDAHGPVAMVKMERSYFGRALLPVHCYAVGDTLVDTGLCSLGDPLSAFAKARRIRRAFITHHHEDHAGNAARLVRDGVRVEASRKTADLVGRPLPIHFYQHVLWGAMAPARVETCDEVQIGPYAARVVPAPGHCEDQVVFHVAEEGWLFSGDAFIHEHVRIFRRDEDFGATVATLEKLHGLDFDVLFCAHRPRLSRGREALGAKLQWLRDIEGHVRLLAKTGAPVDEMVDRVGLARRSFFPILTFGDASPANMIRSILYGPTPRP